MKFLTPLSMVFCAILASVTALASTQHTTFVNLAPVPKWQVEKTQNVSLNDVRQWGVEPLVDHEYGVTKVEVRTYRKDNQSIQAVVEKTPDPSSAYGLLTFYQNESMKREKNMKLTVVGPDQAYMARGVFFVRVLRPVKPQMSKEDFRSALVAIAGAEPSSNAMALLPPSLPPQALIPGSEKYFLGPVAMQRAMPSFPANLVGFRQGAEVQTAAYRHNGQPLTLMLISYPTTAIARLHYDMMEKSLGINQKSRNGRVYGKFKGSYVLLVQNARSREIADRLMSRLTIRQEVSWDQPPPGKPVTVQMFHLIMGNMLLIMLLVGMAVFAGFLFFVSRRVAARWFPHWDWAQAYEDSIIRLNLR